MTRCRCGHGIAWHKSRPGRRRRACEMVTDPRVRRPGKMNGGMCVCRAYVPVPGAVVPEGERA